MDFLDLLKSFYNYQKVVNLGAAHDEPTLGDQLAGQSLVIFKCPFLGKFSFEVGSRGRVLHRVFHIDSTSSAGRISATAMVNSDFRPQKAL